MGRSQDENCYYQKVYYCRKNRGLTNKNYLTKIPTIISMIRTLFNFLKMIVPKEVHETV